MFSFAFPISPAATAHYEAQLAFCNELSRTMSESLQKICEANLQLGKGMFGDAWKPQSSGDGMTAGAEGPRLALDRIVAYRQHLAHLGATLQVDLAGVRTRHAPATTRTAQALAEEVTHAIADRAQQGANLSKAANVTGQRAREQADTDQAGRDMHAEGHVDATVFPPGGQSPGRPGNNA